VFHGGLEHLKIKMRLIDEKFVSVMGECVYETIVTLDYVTIKREINKRLIHECGCDERRKTKSENT
jgi:hypothetical protein